jgi:hypothetical protein
MLLAVLFSPAASPTTVLLLVDTPKTPKAASTPTEVLLVPVTLR